MGELAEELRREHGAMIQHGDEVTAGPGWNSSSLLVGTLTTKGTHHGQTPACFLLELAWGGDVGTLRFCAVLGAQRR